jgi:6-phosphogluconate dehydrogenase
MQAGIIGLGVMGRNLALNLRDSGFNVVCTDPWQDARDWRARDVDVVASSAALVGQLAAPRVILLMVKAGQPVDDLIGELAPLLSPGDVIIDGGNSHHADTDRRHDELADKGIGFVGVGISGGAEGARNGAALMIGADEDSWTTAQPMLTAVSATAPDGARCSARFGHGGAGHFVKMVHNGIEYAIMQAIAECYHLLRHAAGLSPHQVAGIFKGWNEGGPSAGFLLAISAEILATDDPETGSPLIDLIGDAAGQKGTGGWTTNAGIDYGVAVPSIAEAVAARQISSEPALRRSLSTVMSAPGAAAFAGDLPALLEQALTGTIIAALSQGTQLYLRAAQARGWSTDLPSVLRVWRAGSILAMPILDELADVAEATGGAPVLLEIPTIASRIAGLSDAWRKTLIAALEAGIAAPVLSASCNYVHSLSSPVLATALVQAQRDRFGAHGFARVDKPGAHHGPWHTNDPEAAS